MIHPYNQSFYEIKGRLGRYKPQDISRKNLPELSQIELDVEEIAGQILSLDEGLDEERFMELACKWSEVDSLLIKQFGTLKSIFPIEEEDGFLLGPAEIYSPSPAEIQGIPNASGSDCFLNSLIQNLAIEDLAIYFDPEANPLVEGSFDLNQWEKHRQFRRMQALMHRIIQKINNPNREAAVTRDEISELRRLLAGPELSVIVENGLHSQQDLGIVMEHLLNLMSAHTLYGNNLQPNLLRFHILKQGDFEWHEEILPQNFNSVVVNNLPSYKENPDGTFRRIISQDSSTVVRAGISINNELENSLGYEGMIPVQDSPAIVESRNGRRYMAHISRLREKTLFHRLPNVIPIHLLRFDHESRDAWGRLNKNNKAFHMPLKKTFEDSSGNRATYSLKAFSVHDGSKDAGHYRSHRKKGGNWQYANDNVELLSYPEPLLNNVRSQISRKFTGESDPRSDYSHGLIYIYVRDP